jgi:hypothetical protein
MFSEDEKEMHAHEIICDFNPINRRCMTCNNRVNGVYGDKFNQVLCKVRKDWMDVDDGFSPCEQWEIEQNS